MSYMSGLTWLEVEATLFTCMKNLGTKNVQKWIDLLRHPPQDTPIYANLAVKVFVFNFVR